MAKHTIDEVLKKLEQGQILSYTTPDMYTSTDTRVAMYKKNLYAIDNFHGIGWADIESSETFSSATVAGVKAVIEDDSIEYELRDADERDIEEFKYYVETPPKQIEEDKEFARMMRNTP